MVIISKLHIDPPALGEATLHEFRLSLRGELLTPGDDQYDETRKLWNGMFDKRPALIARCACADDVIASVLFARSHGLLVAVRGGGHSSAGHSMCNGGLVIDLSLMKEIKVNPAARSARVDPGVLLGELDQATQEFGLAVPAGQISHTGVAGLTLGGGLGWLMRKHGLTIDNLLSVEIVTADGRLIRASDHEHADLFWGVRGGGGNFGIVTSFEFRLHPVGPMVLAGPVVYTLDKAKNVLQFVRRFMEAAPDDLAVFCAFLTVPPVPPFPEHLWGKKVLAVDTCYSGEIEEGEKVVQPLRAFGSPDLDLIGPMPFTVRQSMLDGTAPHGLHYYDKFHFLCTLKDEAIDTLIAQFTQVVNPLEHMIFGWMGGAVARVAEDATAFPHRDAPNMLWIIGVWEPGDEAEPNIGWVRGTWEAMRPFANGGVYVNALGEEGQSRLRHAYGPNYDRLVALKDRYDPTNFFRLNQNIEPSV